MSNIHLNSEIANIPFTAPIHYPTVKHSGFKPSLYHRLCVSTADQGKLWNILCYACHHLKPVGRIVNDETFIDSMVFDFGRLINPFNLSNPTLKRYTSYLVKCNILIKHKPHKSKNYLINPHFYNTFCQADIIYYNTHLKQMFSEIIL